MDKRNLLIGLLLCAASVCGARVFFRAAPGRSHDALLQACRGKPAYAAEVTINGAAGRLAVFSATDPVEQIARLCRTTLGDTCKMRVGDRSASGIALRDGEVLRLLAFECEPAGRAETIVVTLAQREADYQASLRGENAAIPPAPAVFPGSHATLCVADARANLALHLASAAAEAPAVEAALDGLLKEQRWVAVFPGSATRRAPRGVRLYTRGAETVVLLVSATANIAECAITLLHKGPGIE